MVKNDVIRIDKKEYQNGAPSVNIKKIEKTD